MKAEKTAIYKAIVSTPIGNLLVAVDSTAQDAKADIYSVLSADMNCHIGLLRVKDVIKSNRTITKGMNPIKKSARWEDGSPQYWAWVART